METEDFLPDTFYLTIPAMTGLDEEVCEVFQIGNIVDDFIVEDIETFLLVLSSTSNDGVTIGNQDAISIGIIDNDGRYIMH